MLVNDKQALARLSSSGNLLNRINNRMNNSSANRRRSQGMSIFMPASPGKQQVNNQPVEPKQFKFTNPFAKQQAAPDNELIDNHQQIDAVEAAGLEADDKSIQADDAQTETDNLSRSDTQTDTDNRSEASPRIEDLVESAEYDIKLQAAHNKAIDVLTASLEQLEIHLPMIRKPEALADVAGKTMKVIDSVRREKLERSKTDKNKSVQYHFYIPQQKKLQDYDIIDVG